MNNQFIWNNFRIFDIFTVASGQNIKNGDIVINKGSYIYKPTNIDDWLYYSTWIVKDILYEEFEPIPENENVRCFSIAILPR